MVLKTINFVIAVLVIFNFLFVFKYKLYFINKKIINKKTNNIRNNN